MRILIVEDEAKLAGVIRETLEADEEKYDVEVAFNGEAGFFLVQAKRFDLMILDVMLPGRDGFQILSTLRDRGVATPVLILTARDAIEDRVHGLDLGADDYLVKPFAFPELLARVRAIVRRQQPAAPGRFQVADLKLDPERRNAIRGEEVIELTPREFDLLEYLLLNKGHLVSREMLARDIWKETNRYTPIDNVIDPQITRLRRKIDGRFTKKLLHTVRGVGFVIRDEDES